MPYKVLIVDDSAFMRSELKRIIEEDPELKVIATAENGRQAIDRVKEFQPHVVTMDINMPVMDGIEALKQIMQKDPVPIVMISALTAEGAEETMDALNYGAFDFIHKPSGSISLDISLQGDIIREKIKIAASSQKRFGKNRTFRFDFQGTISTISKLKQTLKTPRTSRLASHNKLIGIGVSTGGPRTLMEILPQIPRDFLGSILVAQHMPEKFTLSFAKRLDKICPLRVKEAKDGDVVQSGMIYIAPGGKHTMIKKGKNNYFVIETTNDVSLASFVPSVEILFNSLNRTVENRWLGIILTGMGSDGATALTELRKMGGHTIAESEESCVVFGMPRKAIEMEGAEFILKNSEIADKIVEIIGNATCH